MKVDTTSPDSSKSQSQPAKGKILGLPNTRLGWWAGSLMVTFVILFVLNSFVLMPPSINALFPRAF